MSFTRSRERTVNEALILTRTWIDLCHGVIRLSENDVKITKRLSAEQAAALLGVSKNSLDDIFKFLRYALVFGFKFESCGEEKFGQLRRMVNN